MVNESYLAGLFDGDGYFTIAKVKGKPGMTVREYRFQAYAAITLREGWALEKVRDLFGGHLKLNKARSQNHADTYNLTWTGKALFNVLPTLVACCLLKKRHATLVFELCKLKQIIRNQPVSDDLYNRQLEIYQQLQICNKKGVSKDANQIA